MGNDDIARINQIAAANDPRQSARRLLLSAALEEVSSYDGNVIPESASTWYDPKSDGEGKGALVGERALCLSRIATAAAARRTPATRSAVPAADSTTLALAASQSGPSAFSLPDEIARYHAMAKKEFGTADSEMDEDPTDDRQPRKGGVPISGIVRDGFGAEATAVINRYFASLKGKLADQSMFGQRDRGSSFSGHGSGRTGGY